MQRTDVNPWTWQEQFGFSQCIDVKGVERLVVLAGQGPVDEDGAVLHVGDVGKQVEATFDNLETVLEAAGFTLADVVRLTVFTTDIDGFFAGYASFAGRLAQGRCVPTSSLIGVSRLALEGMAVELEATVVA